MNLRENIKKLNEKDASRQQALIQKWKEEADANMKAMSSEPNHTMPWDEMKGYRSYDAASAYKKITGQNLSQKSKVILIWKKWAVAAVFAGLMAFSAWMLTQNATAPSVYATSANQNTAILTDGSKLTIDKYSTVNYDGDRGATVKGRVFFNVAKKGNRSPFTVKLNKGMITVLGTRFSVTSMPGETSVAVEEGSVKYEYGSRSIILKAGDRMKLSDEVIVSSPIISGNEFSWKTRMLEFRNIPLEQAIQDISRHYQQELVFNTGIAAGECLLTSRFTNESLDEVMTELSHLFQIKYQKQGSRYVITFLKC